jgi:Ca2+-binding RTX toxin-like protein
MGWALGSDLVLGQGTRTVAKAVTAVATALLVSASSASASDLRCSHDPGSAVLLVTVLPDGPGLAPTLSQRGNRFEIDDADPGASAVCDADAREIDLIRIRNASPSASAELVYLGARFGPGATDEPGSSDEIEISIAFGAGKGRFGIHNPGGALDMRIGGTQINLNADETSGIDADIRASGVTGLLLNGSDGADSIVGSGGRGTPRRAASLAIFAAGLGGADRLVGGAGGDSLFGTDGNDRISGGPGNDRIGGDAGQDVLRGDAGRDVCFVQRRADSFAGCEVLKP